MKIKEILLVDEKTPIIPAIGFILKSNGYMTMLAPDAETASAELDNYCFNLMLVYLTGHEKDKLALLREVKRRSPRTQIMVAGNPQRETLPIEAFQAGVDDYLFFPFSATELCRRVEICLKKNIAKTSESRAEEINAKILNSLSLTFRNFHNSFVSMLPRLKVLKDEMGTQNDLNRVELLNDLSKNVSNCYGLSEDFLYKTFICRNTVDHQNSKKVSYQLY